MKYNLNGTSNELRAEICALQKDIGSIRECNQQLKQAMSNDSADGFFIGFFCVVLLGLSFFWGRASA